MPLYRRGEEGDEKWDEGINCSIYWKFTALLYYDIVDDERKSELPAFVIVVGIGV
jgi:hypothetical protein